jgi:hypothetical protein
MNAQTTKYMFTANYIYYIIVYYIYDETVRKFALKTNFFLFSCVNILL